jgi:TonB family protein
MALILVVEPESRYIERIRDALTSEGWQVRAVGGSQEALSTAEREPPQLVLVSRESEGADRLFQTFSRRTGGPGVVALLPERTTLVEEPAADDALAKPFTDQDLRLAVRRGLKPKAPASPATPQAATPAEDDRQLTAQDIFGDLVAEVESEIRGPTTPRPASERSSTRTSPAPTSSASTAPASTSPASTTSLPRPAERRLPDPGTAPGAPRETPKRKPSTDELDLERTLSGLRRDVGLGSRPDRSPPKAPPKTTPLEPDAAPEPRSVRPDASRSSRPKRSDTDLDVEALLSETLSGFDLPAKKKTKKKRSPSPPEEPPARQTHPEESSLAGLLSDEDDLPPPTQVQPPPDLAGPPTPAASATGPATAGDPGGDGIGFEGLRAGTGKESEHEEEEIEISFAELSAPSLQEVPEPFTAGPGVGPEIRTDLDDLGVAEPVAGTPDRSAPAGDGLPPETGTTGPGQSLADWLESAQDSMFAPDDSPPDTGAEPPQTGSGDAADSTVAADSAGDSSRATDQRFGQYTLLDRIAVGGMAEVWKARSTGIEGFQKTVAIKKILPHLTDNDDFVNMFIDEAKLAAQLSHPNIIHIYDLGKIGDHFYIAMEYVEGKNLRAVLNESRRKALPLPRGLALLIAARLASALDYAHRKKDFEDRELGLVHRDVSPQNVLLSDEGDIKLCDFGIVKAVSKASQTQMGALKGKLQYMSPEQAWGKEVDGRSDLFSLGAILFEMLTGRRLFTGDSEISVLESVRQCRVVAPRELVPQIPEPVEAITLKALSMDPAERYQTAGEMQQELENVLYSVKPTPSPADLAEFLRRLAEAPEVNETELVPAPGSVAEDVSAEPVEPQKGPQERPPAEQDGEALSSLPPLGGATTTAEPEGSGPSAASPPGSPTRGDSSQPSGPAPAPETVETGGPVSVTARGEARSDAPGGAPYRPAATAMPALADYDLEELEEGGGRGKLWLVVLIVLLVAVGAAALYYVYFVRPSSVPPGETPETEAVPEQPSPPVPSPLDEVEDGTEGDDATPEAVGSAVRPSTPDRGRDQPLSTAAAAPPRATGSQSRRTSETPGTSAAERAGDARTGSVKTAGARTPEAKTPEVWKSTELRSTAAPSRSRTEPAPTVAAGSREPPPPTPGGAESPPSSPQTPFTLREGTSSPSGPSPAAPLETTESDAPERPRADAIVLREPTPREPTASPPGPETPAASGAESEPPVPEPEPPPEPQVREGDLVGPGPGVTPPVLVRFDKPSYPPIARRMKVEGEVVVSLLVDEDGRVVEARLIQGVREGVGLHQVALDAARRARYRPATKNGVRVKMWTTLRIPFRL